MDTAMVLDGMQVALRDQPRRGTDLCRSSVPCCPVTVKRGFGRAKPNPVELGPAAKSMECEAAKTEITAPGVPEVEPDDPPLLRWSRCDGMERLDVPLRPLAGDDGEAALLPRPNVERHPLGRGRERPPGKLDPPVLTRTRRLDDLEIPVRNGMAEGNSIRRRRRARAGQDQRLAAGVRLVVPELEGPTAVPHQALEVGLILVKQHGKRPTSGRVRMRAAEDLAVEHKFTETDVPDRP